MKKGLLSLLWLSAIVLLQAQTPFTFTNSNSKLNVTNFHSGNSVSVVDLNSDGLDDIARLDDANDLYYELQKTNDRFTNIHALVTGSGSSWAMVVADVNNDGIKETAVGYNGSAKVVYPNAALTNFTMTTLPGSNYFLQNMNFADINNDGWNDLFGCNDVGLSKMWGNNGSGQFPATSNFFSPATFPASDNSGNYGSVFTDFDTDGDLDFYVAHCRQGVNSSTDPRRINQLFINNGSNVYKLDSFNTRGLNSGAQTWTANFEDIDNDGDFDCLMTNHDVSSKIYRNNNGVFTDITTGSGFALSITPIQSKLTDLDNDGWVDIIVTGTDVEIFRNNGNSTFTEVTGLFNNNNMESFAVGDLNHDGRMDIYASYASIYNSPTTTDDVIWMNTTQNNNHFIAFNLQGTISNRDALGAKVFIYGSWGTQVREVRAGESYGTTNTFTCHFGLGNSPQIDSAVIKWPSGITTVLLNPVADQFIHVKENDCVSADNIVTTTGPSVICPGQSVTLNAVSGVTYLWSTGDTTQSIEVNTAGEYNVRIANGNCFSISKTITVVASPDETPVISANSPTAVCPGEPVQISSTAASSYLWSNGDTTQTITVTTPGVYSVTTSGVCDEWISNELTITNYNSDVTQVSGGAVCESGSITLNSTGTGMLYWYDAATGGNLLGTGTSLTTPVLNASTSYWVESRDTMLAVLGSVGAVDTAIGTGGLFNNNQALIFDVLQDCKLVSVKVYAGSAGQRTIQLRNAGGTVLQSAVVNINAGTQIVNLNFNLTAGTGYRLGWANNSNPNLWRNNTGGNYPYNLNGFVTITGNTANNNAFYYCYYDWKVEQTPEISCVSPREEVVATINDLPTVSFSGLDTQYDDTVSAVTLIGIPAGGTFSGTGISGDVFSPNTAGAGGPYDITYSYTDINGCAASTTQQVSVRQTPVVGILDINNSLSVLVYPNPATEVLYIQPQTAIEGNVMLTLRDAAGRTVKKATFSSMEANKASAIEMQAVAAGLYMLTIQHGNQQAQVKISIQ